MKRYLLTILLVTASVLAAFGSEDLPDQFYPSIAQKIDPRAIAEMRNLVAEPATAEEITAYMKWEENHYNWPAFVQRVTEYNMTSHEKQEVLGWLASYLTRAPARGKAVVEYFHSSQVLHMRYGGRIRRVTPNHPFLASKLRFLTLKQKETLVGSIRGVAMLHPVDAIYQSLVRVLGPSASSITIDRLCAQLERGGKFEVTNETLDCPYWEKS